MGRFRKFEQFKCPIELEAAEQGKGHQSQKQLHRQSGPSTTFYALGFKSAPSKTQDDGQRHFKSQ